MTTNLLDGLEGLVTPSLLAAASSQLGESQSAVSKGLGAALPLILGGLMQKSSDQNVMFQLMDLLKSAATEPAALADPAKVWLAERQGSGWSDLVQRLLAMVFGKQTKSVTSALAEYSGIKNASASSLMTLAGTMVTALLGDRVRRDGIATSGLMSLLNQQRDNITGRLPAALASAAGLGAVRDAGARLTPRVPEAQQPSMRWLWALAAALAVAVGAWALLSRRAPEVPGLRDSVLVAQDATRRGGQAAGDAAQRAGQAVSDATREGQIALAKLGAFTTRRLATNVELNVPERGVESAVIAYLNDPSKPREPGTWFNFDRLLFETGSATLKPESQEQLKNVAEILKAYPAVKVRIGGYTDNTGDPAANLKLSQDRAANVRNAIVALGVAPDRLSAEGYGQEFPVADNATAEGRQQNRRIALRVTER